MKNTATYLKESWRAGRRTDKGMHLPRLIINNIEWVSLKIVIIEEWKNMSFCRIFLQPRYTSTIIRHLSVRFPSDPL